MQAHTCKPVIAPLPKSNNCRTLLLSVLLTVFLPSFSFFSQSDYLLAIQRAERTKDVLSPRFACVYGGKREKEKAITAGFKTLKDKLMEL